MKTDKANHGSGKTKFNREKSKGQSWVALRNEAIKAGTWRKGT
jgi:hypothetical protein